jgi:hypothetical protein
LTKGKLALKVLRISWQQNKAPSATNGKTPTATAPSAPKSFDLLDEQMSSPVKKTKDDFDFFS